MVSQVPWGPSLGKGTAINCRHQGKGKTSGWQWQLGSNDALRGLHETSCRVPLMFSAGFMIRGSLMLFPKYIHWNQFFSWTLLWPHQWYFLLRGANPTVSGALLLVQALKRTKSLRCPLAEALSRDGAPLLQVGYWAVYQVMYPSISIITKCTRV